MALYMPWAMKCCSRQIEGLAWRRSGLRRSKRVSTIWMRPSWIRRWLFESRFVVAVQEIGRPIGAAQVHPPLAIGAQQSKDAKSWSDRPISFSNKFVTEPFHCMVCASSAPSRWTW